MKNYKVVIVEPNNVYEKVISSGHELNEIVGGNIEYAHFKLGNQVYDIMLNDEGKLLGLPIMAVLEYQFGGIDTLNGNLIISKSDSEGYQSSLIDTEVGQFMHYFKNETVPVFYF